MDRSYLEREEGSVNLAGDPLSICFRFRLVVDICMLTLYQQDLPAHIVD